MSPMVALKGLQRSTTQVVECWPLKKKNYQKFNLEFAMWERWQTNGRTCSAQKRVKPILLIYMKYSV